MKHSLLILSFACAGALASFAESPANASSTLYDNLETSVAEPFGFTVEGTTLKPTGGDVSAVAPADVVYAGDKMEVDSDADNPVRFQTTNNNEQDIVTLDFVLDTAIIPPSVGLATPSDGGAKVGFAVCNTNSSVNYYAYTGSDWVKLSGTPKAEGESFTLKIEIDGRAGFEKARFSVDGTKLTTNSVEWIDCVALDKGEPIKVDFVGSGKVASLTGNRLNITAEVIVIPGDVGNIKIAEDDVKAFDETIKGTKFTTTEDFLAAEATEAFVTATKFSTDLKVAEAYALGLVVKDGDKMVAKDNGALEIKATSPKVEDGKISLAFANVVPPADSDATFSYQLQGSTDGTAWTPIGKPSDAMPSISVDQVGTYNFFKVVTTVTLGQ